MRNEFNITVKVLFKNKSSHVTYNRINKIVYSIGDKTTILENYEVLSHDCPFEACYKLYGPETNVMIYSNELRSISFEKDDRIYRI